MASTDTPEIERNWPGAMVAPEDAVAWIRARMPTPPADEPDVLPNGHRRLGPCGSCGRGVYGSRPATVCHEFGFLWHDLCAEDYPFPGRTRS
jgi:hypothetical protein